MSTRDLIIVSVHVVCASIWIGVSFFVGWFLMPALQDAGPDAGKVMLAVQKRGWMRVFPVIATLTVLTGVWMYRPYMGDSGNAAMLLGIGGVLGIVAYVIGVGVVSRSMIKATALVASSASFPDGPQKAAAMASIRQLRHRALTFARVVSLLVILSAVLMTIAAYV